MTELPPGWRKVPLAAVADVHLGRQRSPKNHLGDQMRPYVRAANVSWSGLRLNDVKTMNFTDSEMVTYRLEPGDLLLGEASGSPREVGKPALWHGEIADCAFQNTLIRVRPKGPNPEYLLHYFRHQALSGTFAAAARGVGIRHLGSDALAKWKVPLPSLPEQRRIAEVLDGADALRVKRNEALTLLEALTRSIFIDLFAAGSSVKTFKTASLRSLAEVVTKGTTPTSVGLSFSEVGVPFLRVQNLMDGFVRLNAEVLHIDPEAHQTLRRSRIEPGDLLVSIAGTIGRVALVTEELPEMNCNQAIAIVRLSSGVSSRYVQAWLALSHDAEKQIRASSVTGTISNLSLAGLGKVKIPIPPNNLQREFERRLALLERQREGTQSARLLLDETFAAISSRAFGGEL